ncbi:UDP-N-acetylmuramoyl-L-alanine--D-glutamate ligase [Pelagibacteraceae bacterium]|nr:UDP-N-acetylmuramoyl-L-alanine--D-glutamate ligase [Pelagibacteraceae bacterium]
MTNNKIIGKKFAIYGLGLTGISTLKYLKKLKVKKIFIWDDNYQIRKKFKIKSNKKKFLLNLNKIDYIVVSPGINISKIDLKKNISKIKNKIITDLDLLYISNPDIKSIVVTGTNGKSTTCKILQCLLKNNFNSQLGGNFGKPVLDLQLKKNSIIIIEASSFQLYYSQYVKPYYSLILNITKDHLDWHKNYKNYTSSKFKIFSLQTKKNFSFLKDQNLIKKFKKEKYLSKLKVIDNYSYKKIKNKISNKYLASEANDENMSFVYALSKVLKIDDKIFINSINKFKGLPHRHEIFFKKKNVIFINDSKATSFEATKFAIKNNKNILWILGGLPKYSDKFTFDNLKKNILKSYIIGKHTKFFEKQLKNKINYKITKDLKKTFYYLFKDIKDLNYKKLTVLFSPASASFDQYKNFMLRGNEFKKLTKYYGNKFF